MARWGGLVIVDCLGTGGGPISIAAVLWGLVYGFVLFGVGAIFWLKIVLGLDTEMQMAGRFLPVHLVYGALLGA